MKTRELAIEGAWEFVPRQFPDRRGNFSVWYDEQFFAEVTGHDLRLGQTNHAVSSKGTIRGVHYAQVPPGQAKYVYCPRGAVLDVIVDIRVGSPTFGQWDAVELNGDTLAGVYLSEGLGHSYVALADDSILVYLCSERYRPQSEFGIDPLDPALDLPWPTDIPQVLSDRDLAAPSLSKAQAMGILPSYAAYKDVVRSNTERSALLDMAPPQVGR